MSRTNKQTKAKNCFGQKNRNFVIILKYYINAPLMTKKMPI